jgi:hypothetical protein
MRPEHKSLGDPCAICAHPASAHTAPLRVSPPSYVPPPREDKDESSTSLILGIDGEGLGRKNHAYVLLAASDAHGSKQWSLEAPSWRASWDGERYTKPVHGIETWRCLEFLLDLPARARVFSYAFNYDLTKILTDVDDKGLFRLFRPTLRARHGEQTVLGPKPVKWEGYTLNLQGTQFTVTHPETGRRRVVWDIFKFYGCKFVNALIDWKTGDEELWGRMSQMKDKRGEFDKESPDDVKSYCFEETECMAIQADKLIKAHDAVGLPMKVFHGAGSSAGAMLRKMGIREQLVPCSEEMKRAVAMAFFGGRFENSVIGPIRERLFNFDISSAYPYHLFFLPCLVHGKWEFTKNRKALNGVSHALVHYGFRNSLGTSLPWGPFPFRTDDGSICFPAYSGGGWVYLAEYLAGEKLFPAVEFREAWVYRSECECKPFADIPTYYVERLRIGKEGPGLTLKLAINSCYGKLAQSIGNALFNSWLWAGMITSGCRGQALELMGLYKDLRNILMIATDGVCGREDVPPPLPLETGTGKAVDPKGQLANKPLGGWERKVLERGLFLARPGINFPLEPTKDDIKEIKGRGVGRGVILDNHARILKSWEEHRGAQTVEVANVNRFCGAKTSISRSGKPGAFRYKRASGEAGPEKPSYGQWTSRKVEMGFDPMPKRCGVGADGVSLRIRHTEDGTPKSIFLREESAPYSKVILSKEARELKEFAEEMAEQPDFDMGEYADWEEVDI